MSLTAFQRYRRNEAMRPENIQKEKTIEAPKAAIEENIANPIFEETEETTISSRRKRR